MTGRLSVTSDLVCELVFRVQAFSNAFSVPTIPLVKLVILFGFSCTNLRYSVISLVK